MIELSVLLGAVKVLEMDLYDLYAQILTQSDGSCIRKVPGFRGLIFGLTCMHWELWDLIND